LYSGILLVLAQVACWQTKWSIISFAWSMWPQNDCTFSLQFLFLFLTKKVFACKSIHGMWESDNVFLAQPKTVSNFFFLSCSFALP
jgi:hypothetical protein